MERAISIFEKKFSDKTKNNWSERHDFVKVAGKYDLVGTDFGDNSEEEDEVDYNIANDIDNRKQDGQKGEKSKETSAKKKSQASDNNSRGPSNRKENKRSGSKANSNLDLITLRVITTLHINSNLNDPLWSKFSTCSFYSRNVEKSLKMSHF